MRRRTVSIAIVCFGLSTLAAAAYFAAKPQGERPVASILYPKEPADRLLWPTNHSSIWSINRLDQSKGDGLSVVVRVKHEPLDKNHSVVIAIVPPTFSKSECDSEISLGTINGVKSTDTAIVALQMIDVSEIGLAAEKRPLRVILSLRVRGSTIWHKGSETIIEGERIAGHTYHDEPTWKDGELHLKCIYVRTGDRLAKYDVLVIGTN